MTGAVSPELAAWLRSQGISSARGLTASPLSGGQSNPTFLLVDEEGSRFVLRKKPAGVLLPSAHAIDREHRVMRALQDSGVPVPRMLGFCEDEAILGTPFFAMEYLEGRVFMDPALPGMDPAERAAMYRDMNRVIAVLHGVDFQALGLGDYGRPGNYLARQIARWSRQCEAATVPLPPALRRLMEWLPAHLPADERTTLVHGDYRLDNLVFHPTQPRVIGVLDWELSTLGDPLADFAAHCMSWRVPPQVWRGIAGHDLEALGIPAEDAYLKMYVDRTGLDPSAHWDFYLAYSFFRMAAILHGIAQRAADGTANASDAVETGRKAGPLADLGWDCARRCQA